MNGYYIVHSSEVSWTLFTNTASGFCYNVGENIAHVLNEVRTVFLDVFGNDIVNSHKILSVISTEDMPITFREYNLIFLSSKGLFFNQHIYQFSHELCHFMVPGEVCESYRWLEETLCEIMSWHTLFKIADRKDSAPLVELGPLYDEMKNYAAERQAERVIVESQLFPALLARQLPNLQKNCYNRVLNSTIGYEIFPIFNAYPDLWRIVLHLQTLTDNMSLPYAIDTLCRAAGVVEAGWNQIKQRLLE